ncbi:carbohydrate kinase family protein [Roseateles sp.]|uniref:carbohydrate kinase family protein n=1 Tax=Roseateles sp. TaxID=1971397 RepID=UPI0039E99F91
MTAFPEFVSAGEALTDMIRTTADFWQSRIGGAGFNVARAMARLGVPSAFAGAVSNDVLGRALLDGAGKAGLDLRFMQCVDKSPLLAMVHKTSPPEYFFVGDDSADLHFSLSRLPSGWAQQVRCVHFGGISLARQPLADRLVRLATALKAEGVHISYDPNFRNLMDARYDDTLAAMAGLADVIKVSDEDLEGLFRTPVTQDAFVKLRRMNPAARILLTRGAAGAEYHDGDRAWRAAAPRVALMDTIGAGDASISALLHGLMGQPDSDGAELLRMAVAAGAAACTLPGATPPTLDLVQAIAPTVQVSSLV